MATDGPPVADCDPDVYAQGTAVLMIGSITPNRMEGWCRQLASDSHQMVDWHYVAGRAILRVLGNVQLVRNMLDGERMDALDVLCEESSKHYCGDQYRPTPGRKHWSLV